MPAAGTVEGQGVQTRLGEIGRQQMHAEVLIVVRKAVRKSTSRSAQRPVDVVVVGTHALAFEHAGEGIAFAGIRAGQGHGGRIAEYLLVLPTFSPANEHIGEAAAEAGVTNEIDRVFEAFFEADQPSVRIALGREPGQHVRAAAGIGMHRHGGPWVRTRIETSVAPSDVADQVAIRQIADVQSNLAGIVVDHDADGILHDLAEGVQIDAAGVAFLLDPAHGAHTGIHSSRTEGRIRQEVGAGIVDRRRRERQQGEVRGRAAATEPAGPAERPADRRFVTQFARVGVFTAEKSGNGHVGGRTRDHRRGRPLGAEQLVVDAVLGQNDIGWDTDTGVAGRQWNFDGDRLVTAGILHHEGQLWKEDQIAATRQPVGVEQADGDRL